MAFNGTGTFSRLFSWSTDKTNSLKIQAARMDAEDDGFAAGLSNCVTKDGQTTTTARVPFTQGVSLGDGTLAAPAVNFSADANTGFYRAGADNAALVAGGAKIVEIDGSAASVATGIKITGSAAAGGVNIAAISSGANEETYLNGKGSGAVRIGNLSTGNILIGTGALTLTSAGAISGATSGSFSGAVSMAGLTATTGTFSGVVTHPVGSAALPSVTFSGDLDTGLSAATADTLALSTGGVAALTLSPVGAATFRAGATFAGGLSGITTLGASGVATLTNATASTTSANGAVVVTGGVGIGDGLNVAGRAGFGAALTSGHQVTIAGGQNAGLRVNTATIGTPSGGYPRYGYNLTFGATSTAMSYLQTDQASAIAFVGGEIQTHTAASGTAGTSITFTAGPYVVVGGTSWTNSSDRALKDKIETFSVLDKLGTFRAVSFLWKDSGRPDIGVIHDEIEGGPFGVLAVRNGEGLGGVNYDPLGPIALQGVKELLAEVQALRARVVALEAR